MALDACPLGVCDGSGWLLDDGSDTARPCSCRDRQISRALTERLASGVPKRFRGVSFERRPICDMPQFVLRPVRQFVGRLDERLDEGRGLWFHGDVGTGKTSLAMLVARAALEAGRTTAIYSVPLLLATIRRTYDEGAEDSYMSLFRRLASVDLLVLDDLGAERPTEWVLEQLYALVNERWQDSRSIVITTNPPRPRHDAVLAEAHHELEELRRARERRGFGDALERPLARLEAVIAQLDAAISSDPVASLREQIGARTVSRLIEICDDPILVMGPDLRVAAGAG
ncbi:MAG: ATP-binding protein [Nocardioidaceae bacterium]